MMADSPSNRNCEMMVIRAVESDPLVKLLTTSLSAAGCKFNLLRHVSCEECGPGLAGGYDKQFNQIVICSNSCTNYSKTASVLAHELVHMYDYCVADIDLSNLEHLACTEVRAANLAHCRTGLSAAMYDGGAWTRSRKEQEECVRSRAVRSVKAISKLGNEEAGAAVRKVFEKCYGDLEPVGRRCQDGEDVGRARAEMNIFKGYQQKMSQ